MTKRAQRRLIIAAMITVGLACLVVAVYLFLRERALAGIGEQISAQIMAPHKLPNVDTHAWQRLQVGMTHQQVIDLVGDAPHKCKGKLSDAKSKDDLERIEFWEYGYTYGLFGLVAHPDAYVVYFNQNGTVSSFRAPANSPAKDADQTKP